MAKSKELKAEMLSDAKEVLKSSDSLVFGEYRGLDVEGMTKLRRLSRESDVRLRIYKNTIFKKALVGTKFESLSKYLKGPLVYGLSKDTVAPARLLVDFSKENEAMVVKGGSIDGSYLDTGRIKALASIPPREELLAKFLGVANGPVQGLVSILNEVPSRFVRVLAAIRDQNEKKS